VAAAHGCEVACGFAGQVPLNGIPAGPVVLRVTAVDATGRRAVCRVTVVRDRGTVRPPEARLDVPGPGPAPPRMPAVLAPPAPAAATELGALLATFRDELERDPTVLDLTGLSLAATLPGELVVTPLDAATLPYADQSFDVVAVARDDSARREQARRLATRAVVLVPPEGGHRILWGGGGPATRFPRVSVVIPVFNQSACTRACLRAVLDTWPASLEGEVLVVDDGSTDDTADMVARAGRARPARPPAPAGREPRLRRRVQCGRGGCLGRRADLPQQRHPAAAGLAAAPPGDAPARAGRSRGRQAPLSRRHLAGGGRRHLLRRRRLQLRQG
jgi:hypothetical protein